MEEEVRRIIETREMERVRDVIDVTRRTAGTKRDKEKERMKQSD